MTTTSITTDYSKFLTPPTAKFKKALYRHEQGEKTRYSTYTLDIRWFKEQIIPQPETHFDWDIAKANARNSADRIAFVRQFHKLKKARVNSFYKRYEKEIRLHY